MRISDWSSDVCSSDLNALMSHPAVLQCAVIGVPDPKWGEAVHAYVQLRNDATTTTDDLQVQGKSLIANYKCPKSFTLLHEQRPMSGLGKVLKGELSQRREMGGVTSREKGVECGAI